MTINLSIGAAGRTPLLSMLVLMLVAIACASCSMNLSSQPQTSGQSIAGHWQLQSPSRQVMVDSLRVVMEQARANQDQLERRRYPHGIPPEEGGPNPEEAAPLPVDGMPQSGAGPQGAWRRNNWEVREQREQHEALLGAVLPSNKLQIIQSPNRVEMMPDTGGRRRFEIGVDITQVTTYATFLIESGWQKNVFVVHARDRDRRVDVVQRYQRVGADALRLQVELSFPNAPDQFFTADYVPAQP
jgi:hypothetical protein